MRKEGGSGQGETEERKGAQFLSGKESVVTVALVMLKLQKIRF